MGREGERQGCRGERVVVNGRADKGQDDTLALSSPSQSA